MKTIGVTVLLFVPFVYATKGFTYNDDIVCGYPFENFVIETISCAPPSYVHVWPEGGQPSNIYDSHDVCAFGNEMEISGKVTVSQAVARVYHANLNACFRTSEMSWYSAKKCMLFRTTMDLRTYSISDAEAEGDVAEGDAATSSQTSSQTYIDYVEPGEFSFSARVLIPKKTFVFNSDYMVTADLSLVPNSHSSVVDTYKFTSVCSATFDAIYDASTNRYSNKYAAATIVAIGLFCSAYIAGGKSRRICTGNNEEVDEGKNDFVEMNKIDEEAESDKIESRVFETQPNGNSNVSIDTRQSKRLFPDFLRRPKKAIPTTKDTDVILISADSVVEKTNAFVAL